MAKLSKSNLSGYLRKKREAAGISQKEVADRLGYSSAQFISNWERGVSSPPLDALKKLAAMYSVNAEEIFDALLQESVAELVNEMKRKFNSGKSR